MADPSRRSRDLKQDENDLEAAFDTSMEVGRMDMHQKRLFLHPKYASGEFFCPNIRIESFWVLNVAFSANQMLRLSF